jgi:hypothetical protein
MLFVVLAAAAPCSLYECEEKSALKTVAHLASSVTILQHSRLTKFCLLMTLHAVLKIWYAMPRKLRYDQSKEK